MVASELETLSEDERRALRGSKFAPLPSLPSSSHRSQPRLAHPGGPLRTNKAAALAKFLERKLQEPDGLASINPDLVEVAVQNAKRTVLPSCGTSNSGTTIQHVDSFGDTEDSFEEGKEEKKQKKNKNKNKNKKNNKNKKEKKEKRKNKKRKFAEDPGNAVVKKCKQKLKL
ncbi:hypothetical protein RGQ29_023794 [Quercus rubra]|uniref:Uncharacterized protein n=1 Tax=Quercus rubra TaxID=3512 RepID=A0AAN7F8N0_QUERU|nr:hypothetical protein RGQ29_023794 [Quercus rubra]